MIGAGNSIGNYRILQKIGTGGMGAVYLAEHPLIGKKVALKVIHRELAGNKEVVQRFFQEARAVNQIGNEHIVEIHDFGVTPEGDHFYIMEYLEGRTLASHLAKNTALDVVRSLHIGAQIASALGAAHACGIIHRDLKPDNIMLIRRLGEQDFVKVLDFGLAKILAGGSGAVKTAYGVLLGTPQYMSPEACESKGNVDRRTDIYALGVLLFQMMTGVLPFDGESMGEVLVKQVTQLPPAPRGINPGIPPSVEQILLRCLAKPMDSRFLTMDQLRTALLDPEAYLRGSPPIAPARSVAPGEAKVNAQMVMEHAAKLQAQKQAAQQRTQIADPGWAPGGVVAPLGDQAISLPAPVVPENKTMMIGTPFGYTSRPPRKVWPIVLVLGLLLGIGGGAFAVAWFGRDDGSGDPETVASGSGALGSVGAAANDGASEGSASGSGSGSSSGGSANGSGSGSAEPGSGSAKVGSGSAAPATVKLVIESTPAGASVYTTEGKLLGTTRLELDWTPSGEPVTFELRMTGYKTRTKQLVVADAMSVSVELEKAPPAGRGSAKGSGARGSGARGSGKATGTGLIRPGD